MSKFTKGLLFGAVIGGVYTLLTSPQDGQTSRRQLKAYLTNTRTAVGDFSKHLEDLVQALQHVTAQTNQVMQTLPKEINRSTRQFEAQAQPRLRRIEAQVQKIQTEVTHLQENLEEGLN